MVILGVAGVMLLAGELYLVTCPAPLVTLAPPALSGLVVKYQEHERQDQNSKRDRHYCQKKLSHEAQIGSSAFSFR
jgi:hypothetical protein